MTSAASRRRGAAVLVLALLVAVLALGVPARRGDAQVLCEDEDGAPVLCPTTTEVDDTTSTIDEETTTTEDTVDDTDTTEADQDDDDEEVVTATTLTVSTLQNVLIPGDGTEGAESTTTTSKTLASGGDGLSDEQLILLIVGGLGLAAAVVSLLTWRYWVATRPTVAEARAGRSASSPM